MDPAFPDIVGEWAGEQIDDRAKVWMISRGADGRLEERLDPSFLARLEEAESAEDVADALVIAAARQDVEASRVW
jgi:hypothetical protein